MKRDKESVMPAVSVIVPVYNIKALLPRGVASLRAQTWQDFEVWLRGGRDRRMQKNSR
ncbi:glycosyltransferase [Faecalibacterium prausnitzii]|uniref:glycosyltransferase n=1 Tax=Faecalibacterium prausnitzii TaxID=853 RepID=UPI003DA0ADEC